VLTRYLGAAAVDFDAVLAQAMADAEEIKPLVTDVSAALHAVNQAGHNLLFEGAQGALLDIDHGTYPFVTSSNCVAGQAAAGSGIGPGMLHYVLGITKAYCTRVGGGPFPSELDIETAGLPGHQMSQKGCEFGTVTGRKRRCGWLDAAALKRSIQINGVTGLCITKLDVLDGLSELKICAAYRLDGKTRRAAADGRRRGGCLSSPCSRPCQAGPSPRSVPARWRLCRQRRVPIWRASKNSAVFRSTSCRPVRSVPRRSFAVILWVNPAIAAASGQPNERESGFRHRFVAEMPNRQALIPVGAGGCSQNFAGGEHGHSRLVQEPSGAIRPGWCLRRMMRGAVDKAITVTNPRLTVLPSCHRRLTPAVETTIEFLRAW
jgi:hypothetical protein